jgi:hypothetical protein
MRIGSGYNQTVMVLAPAPGTVPGAVPLTVRVTVW